MVQESIWGEFKYNGRNSTQIADMILRTIKNYHFNLLNVVDKSDKFFKKTKRLYDFRF